MTIKETVLKESIEAIESRLSEIESLLDVRPRLEISRLNAESRKIMEDNRDDLDKMAELLKPLKDEEIRLSAVEERRDTPKLVNEKSSLKIEMMRLESELRDIEGQK